MRRSCLTWLRALLFAGAVAIVVAACSDLAGVRPVDTARGGESWDPSRGLITGTVFFDSDVMIPSDRSTFEGITFIGRETRTVFDRRYNDDGTRESGGYHEVRDMYVYHASYEDLPGISAEGSSFEVVEVLVNPEFEAAEAERLAESYARLLGQQPAMLRSAVVGIVIHDGDKPWGGGTTMTVHDDWLTQPQFVGEVVMHEAGHAALDYLTYETPEWLVAVMQDGGRFASEYAEDFPNREDVAESYAAWFAVRYRSDRMTSELTRWIERTIPGRLAYFDARLAAGDGGFAAGMCPVVEADCLTRN